MTRNEWRKMNKWEEKKRRFKEHHPRFSTAKMIPLKKPLTAWWYAAIEGDACGYIEKHQLPAGVQCGDFRVEIVGKAGSIVSFLSHIEPGIFNRYRVLVRGK